VTGGLRGMRRLAQSRVICDATDLPVSADLEKGSVTLPKLSRRRSGLQQSRDSSLLDRGRERQSDAPIFEIGHATERIAAAAAAARALPFPFTLTGRTENFLRGRLDLEDTIKRLKAYEAAGADALMAPGLPDLVAGPCGSAQRSVSPSTSWWGSRASRSQSRL